MAVLSTNNRSALWAEIMRECSRLGMSMPFLKAEGRAALDSIDQWCDDNAAAFNSNLPQPFRGAASAKLKAMMFMYVVAERHDVQV